uniref:non-specific serine/threonine protein kinase n=1 Tax=Hanusia phi TaxID=3032 RepID=A0A7S0F3Q2_9CRYP
MRTSRVGTPAYLAPEMLQREGTGEPVDIWGLGCVALELVTLSFLTDRKGMLGVEVLSTPLDAGRLPHRFSPSLRRCIVSMLCSDPGQRPTATEVLETCQTSTPLEPLSGAYKARQDRAIAKARTGAAPTAGRGEPRPDSSQDDSQSESKSSQDDWSASILGLADSLLNKGLAGLMNSQSFSDSHKGDGESTSRSSSQTDRRDGESSDSQSNQRRARQEPNPNQPDLGVARGKCGECGQTVWTSQNRMKGSDGTYYHETCVLRKQEQAEAARRERARPEVEQPSPDKRDCSIDDELDPAIEELEARHGRVGKKDGNGTFMYFDSPGHQRPASNLESEPSAPPIDAGYGESPWAQPPDPTAPSWREDLGGVQAMIPEAPAEIERAQRAAAERAKLAVNASPHGGHRRAPANVAVRRTNSSDSSGSSGPPSPNNHGVEYGLPVQVSALPGTAVNEKWIVCSASAVNMRAEPSLKSQILGQKNHGDMVQARKRIEGNGGWIQLAEQIDRKDVWMRIADGRRVLLSRVQAVASEEAVPSSFNVRGKWWLVVCPQGCNVRDEPNLKSVTISSRSYGDVLEAAECKGEGGGWIRISLPGITRSSGWVRASDSGKAILRCMDGQWKSVNDKYAVVAKTVEVRTGPSFASRGVSKKLAGEIVDVSAIYQYEGHPWMRLKEAAQTPQGPSYGWIPAGNGGEVSLRRFVLQNMDEMWQVVDQEPVKVRAGPSVNATKLDTKSSMTVMRVIGQVDFDGGWLKVKGAGAWPEGWMRRTNGRNRQFLRRIETGLLT